MEDFFADEQASKLTLCGLVFNADSLEPNTTVTYKIRMRSEGYAGTFLHEDSSSSNPGNQWMTDTMYDYYRVPGPRGDMYGGYSPGCVKDKT